MYRKPANKLCKKPIPNKYKEDQDRFNRISERLSIKHTQDEDKNIIEKIENEINKTNIEKKLKNDYKGLMDLVNCRRKMTKCKDSSIMSYKKIINIKEISKNENRNYARLHREILSTCENISKCKYKKPNFQRVKSAEVCRNLFSETPQLIEAALIKGLQNIKNLIPQQAQLNTKLQIFGNILEQQKERHIDQIKKIISRQKQRSKDLVTKNMLIYIVNYYLIQQLMVKVNENPSTLDIKKKYSDIYTNIKKQMIGEVINQGKIRQVASLIENYEYDKTEELKKLYRPLMKTQMTRPKKMGVVKGKARKFCSENELDSEVVLRNKQNDLVCQFEKLYLEAEQKVKQAHLEHKFPFRKNNFYSFVERYSVNSDQVL